VLIEGKWADNEALRRAHTRFASRIFARIIGAAAALLARRGERRTIFLNRSYFRIEVGLPFSGGPSAARLADFLTANSVHDVAVEPLMDATLWGEQPDFPRYLATGTRSSDPRLHG
jgi:hypothetical protein